MSDWKRLVDKGIEEYNRYRSPEAIARLKKISSDKFTVEFIGTYCHTCGFYDYFEDLLYILDDLGLKTKISKIVDKTDDAEVEFQVIGMET